MIDGKPYPYKDGVTVLREYNVYITLSRVDRISLNCLASCDFGEYMHFNISNSKPISALITSISPSGNSSIEICCLISQETYFNFCYGNNDFENCIDYSLDNCLYNGINYLGDYFCG